MGVAALVLGIVSIILAFVPCCGILALLPALIGLILGIVEVVKKSKAQQPKGKGVAGIILSVLAIIIAIVWWLLSAVLIAGSAAEEIENITTNTSDYYNTYYNAYYNY